MIVTHTRSADGQSRIYLGGKSSLECWISPKSDGRAWTFHLEAAVTGNELSPDEERAWAIHTLIELSKVLNVHPADLAAVPYETIAALHAADPFAGRRVACPKRQGPAQGFMSTSPGITRPSSDYSGTEYQQRRNQAR